MKESKFREQLFHRLRECEIHIPPLRERRDDIPGIVEYYLLGHNNDFDDSKFFTPSAIEFLCDQEWGGNVRELASVVRVTLQTTIKETIDVPELHKILLNTKTSSPPGYTSENIISTSRTLKEDLEQVDQKKIEKTLERTNGNVSKAAALLAVSRETLHNKIRKYGINAQMFRSRKVKK